VTGTNLPVVRLPIFSFGPVDPELARRPADADERALGHDAFLDHLVEQLVEQFLVVDVPVERDDRSAADASVEVAIGPRPFLRPDQLGRHLERRPALDEAHLVAVGERLEAILVELQAKGCAIRVRVHAAASFCGSGSTAAMRASAMSK
jgi:hypothetical protein